jgi:oligopeptide/dipeptide ABC transporter ATP-binding protein
MYAGRVAETASTKALFAHPAHPYTRGLFASIPRLGGASGRLPSIAGTVPRPDQWPTGCRFHPRCPAVIARCRESQPALDRIANGHRAACWNPTVEEK